MKEQLVSFETAKLAKELGFDIECVDFYGYNDITKELGLYRCERYEEHKNSNNPTSMSAPPQSLLQRWLREKHGIYVDAPIALYTSQKFNYCVGYKDGTNVILDQGKTYDYLKYEQALEKGLQEALKIIKNG